MSVTFYHPFVFILTFVSYAFFHASRKTFSNVKTTISDEWTPSFSNSTVNETLPNQTWNKHKLFDNGKDAELFLGVLDATFLTSYAVGLYISGMVGDRFDMRKILCFGMCSTAVIVFIFGCVLEWVEFYNKYVYVLLWIINGLLQSTGWPTVVAVMGYWFGKSSRGLVLGLWSACASVGNIIGSLMVSSVLDYGFDYAFLLTCSVLFGGGIVIFFGLVSTPSEVGLRYNREGKLVKSTIIVNETISSNDRSVETDEISAPLIEEEELNKEEEEIVIQIEPRALSLCQALLLPGVILYSLAYAFLKLVNYSFFFWLPYYLSNAHHMAESQSDAISIWYDVGGIIGGTIAGFISDLTGRRAVVVIPMLILSVPALFIYGNFTGGYTINAVLMAVTGFFVGGVANLISAAISADLGQQGPIKDNSKALATVTGIVDGTGSAGAAIGQILVPVIQKSQGWKSVFVLFMIAIALTALCVLPIFINEVKDIYSKYRYSWFTGLKIETFADRRNIEDDSTTNRHIE
ncbi:hypothetical protein LOTGIDRAFT_234009 [Lottia gigantea]|uniref:Sugar phosphate exchanger 3 n=1 Tax=Lottia gigantea TaxID=225164 RepID=V4A4I5_LOTGI|nr:hypothetical protein LOTGIDRAFT_234009 [Lottia gigantea]ESO89870.1 hypothetical protein LOTGIDRAFT_234009 [Lottia gigantea]